MTFYTHSYIFFHFKVITMNIVHHFSCTTKKEEIYLNHTLFPNICPSHWTTCLNISSLLLAINTFVFSRAVYALWMMQDLMACLMADQWKLSQHVASSSSTAIKNSTWIFNNKSSLFRHSLSCAVVQYLWQLKVNLNSYPVTQSSIFYIFYNWCHNYFFM